MHAKNSFQSLKTQFKIEFLLLATSSRKVLGIMPDLSLYTSSCHVVIRMNLWSVIAWLSRNSLLKTGVIYEIKVTFFFFFKLGFTPCKAEQSLRGMELHEEKKKITGYRKSV